LQTGPSKHGNTPRPVIHLNAAGRLYPRAWKLVEDFREQRGKALPDWPDWCFLPVSGWYAIVSERFGADRLPPEAIPDVGSLAALGTWRYSQGIYRFDPDLFAALTKTELTGDVPADVLLRLPEWCVYIETPGYEFEQGEVLHGFFAHMESDANNNRIELRLLLDYSGGLRPFPLHIGPWPLAEAVHKALVETLLQATAAGAPAKVPSIDAEQGLARWLTPLLSLLLYLCSDEPEIGERAEPKPQHPKPTRVKGGWRLFPAARPRIWPVGIEIGQTLRATLARGDAERKGPRPHLRRAHWHGFWSGPRDGERRFQYKWLAPIVVGSVPEKNSENPPG